MYSIFFRIIYWAIIFLPNTGLVSVGKNSLIFKIIYNY